MKKYGDRIVGLDILRTIAILLVVYLHGGLLLPHYFQSAYGQIVIIDGVSIFFVLSGFLIGRILLRIINDSDLTLVDVLNFWIRRWFRTIPNYLFVLIGLLFLRIFIFKNLSNFSFLYFLFLQNFSGPQPNFFPEAWSLGVEEWFYLLFPITCYILHKIFKYKSASILYSALIFLIIPLTLRIIKYELGIGVNDIEEEFRKITVLRLDSLMYGIVAAYVYSLKNILWFKYKMHLLCIGVGLMILMKLNASCHWISIYPPFSFNMESISILLVLPFFSELKTTRFENVDSFFVFISIISYSMYLLNLAPVIHHMIPLTNRLLGYKGLPVEDVFIHNYVLYWVYTILGSYLLYHFYEKRMTDLRERIKL